MSITGGIHLFPFRTEKLSPWVPMVLPYGGRVGWRRIMKAVMIYIVTAFFIFMKIAHEDGVSGYFRVKAPVSCILYPVCSGCRGCHIFLKKYSGKFCPLLLSRSVINNCVTRLEYLYFSPLSIFRTFSEHFLNIHYCCFVIFYIILMVVVSLCWKAGLWWLYHKIYIFW